MAMSHKMTNPEIYEACGCHELVMTFAGLKIAAKTNDATLHHFSCEVEIPDAISYFTWLVQAANKKNSYERKQLDGAKIKNC